MINKRKLTMIGKVNKAQTNRVGISQGDVSRRVHNAAKLAMGAGMLSVGGYILYKTGIRMKQMNEAKKIFAQKAMKVGRLD
jgi:hypothetical protein